MKVHKTITPLLRRVIVFSLIFVIISGVIGSRIIGGGLVMKDGFFVYGGAGKALAFGLIAFVLLVRRSPLRTSLQAWRPLLLGWIVAAVLLAGLAWVSVGKLLAGDRELPTIMLVHIDLLLSIVCAAIGCLGPWNIRLLWRSYRRKLLLSLGIAGLFYLFLTIVYMLWRPLAVVVLFAVRWLLDLNGIHAVVIPPNVLLFDKFGITVAQYCSGIESIALFTGLYVIVGLLDWDRIRTWRYVAVFPLALIGLCLLNILRVYGLVWAGYRINPQIAFSLFHTYAGLVFFILYSAVFWWIAYTYLVKEAD